MGQTADFRFFGPGLGFDTSSKARLDVDPVTQASRIPGVFAGGDLATGPRSAVDAFAAGRRAALAIHAYLQGQSLPADLPPPGSRPTKLVVDTAHVSPAPRQAMSRARPDRAPGATCRRSGAGFQPGRSPGGSGPVPGLHLLPVRQRTALICSTMSQASTQPPRTWCKSWRIGARPNRTHSLFLPYLWAVPDGLPQGPRPRPGLSGGPGAPAAQGKGPLPPHKGVQNYVRWGTHPTFALSRPDPATGKARRVFFPGCSLSGHSPHLVKAAYAYLRERLPDTGIVLNCCGAPSQLLGERKVLEEVTGGVAARW